MKTYETVAKIAILSDMNKIKIDLPSLEEQVESVAKIERLAELSKQHIIHSVLITNDTMTQYLPIFDPKYTPPTGNQVQAVINLIMEQGYSKAEISRYIGVSDIKNRTVLRWEKGGIEESVIPYGAWRLIIAYAGLGLDLKLAYKK